MKRPSYWVFFIRLWRNERRHSSLAATGDFHLNGVVPYHGDNVPGIDRSLSKTESGLRVAQICGYNELSFKGVIMPELYTSLSVLTTETLAGLSNFLPRLAAAILILIIGAGVAKGVKGLVVKLLEALKVSNWVKNTPVEHFFKNAEFGEKMEGVLGSIVYWILMLVVIHSTVSVLGLSSLTHVLDQVLAYLPRIISSVLVLFFGLLVAGVVESLVKGSIKSIDGKSARLLGKVSSYLVLTIVVLAAINELGIASEFIMVMFIGFIVMLSLGLGLALGLGGQHLVKDLLGKWYKQTSKEVKKK
ncbi:MAG: hypothetical protein HN846_04160 [Candidatus Pacebacteria bacterium]|nr:hypothetical protein [Candidatus Paceibacterota bacterium]MBT3511901.1 hypothetical protein [Candidatus Paceibacterota bacterium]MBT4005223.1 hypothetical protein [Candidatus Paceibacterota bacterium]MBT4358943.1 hypothetical protein [Candidatus Paceibacterota bacterium]MBT4680492.1 hypothetical protein [Candidatus Paceibacterota bacterium]